MSTFIVNGGKKLKGSIEVTAGKNAPIAILCGTLLVRGESVLHEMTRVEEVERMLELLGSIGVRYAWRGPNTLWVDTSKRLDMSTLDKDACAKMRISLLLIGALAAREKTFKLYKSGGCHLGGRSVFPHIHALEKFGINVTSQKDHFAIKTQKLKAAHVPMYESGDTATENAIMAAVLAPGTTTITFASANYMVQDLCRFLVAAGAKINGIGTTTLTITGVKRLGPSVSYAISPDPVDAMAWISLAITTRSELTIKRCPLPFLELELEKLAVLGQEFKIRKRRMAKNGELEIADITLVPSTLKAVPHKIYGRPFPGMNIDNVPLFVPILTQAKGRTLVHEWCYENRAVYYLELQKLGANITLLDPHRVYVEGKTAMQGNELICPPAIRPGMAILIAMIAAKGRSVLRHCYPILRAYEDLIPRLQQVGVDITVQES